MYLLSFFALAVSETVAHIANAAIVVASLIFLSFGLIALFISV
jgi:hypothetical protein